MDSLKPIFTSLYNMPIVPFTRFYNTIVMGSGVVAFALSPLVFFFSLWFVKKYRELIVARFKETQFFKALKATSFYKWYLKYDEYYG